MGREWCDKRPALDTENIKHLIDGDAAGGRSPGAGGEDWDRSSWEFSWGTLVPRARWDLGSLSVFHSRTLKSLTCDDPGRSSSCPGRVGLSGLRTAKNLQSNSRGRWETKLLAKLLKAFEVSFGFWHIKIIDRGCVRIVTCDLKQIRLCSVLP